VTVVAPLAASAATVVARVSGLSRTRIAAVRFFRTFFLADPAGS
jgi:hypothetical protein